MAPESDDPFHAGLPTIEGERLRLRAPRPGDEEPIFRIYNDKEANRFGFSPKMDTLADAAALMEEIRSLAAERKIFHWFAALREGDEVVGHATLFEWKVPHKRAELGYSVRKDLWGKGIASEASGLLLDFAFDRLGLRRIEADVDPRNLGSLRVLEKHGFVREGFARQRWEIGEEVQDGVLLGLIVSERTRPGQARK